MTGFVVQGDLEIVIYYIIMMDETVIYIYILPRLLCLGYIIIKVVSNASYYILPKLLVLFCINT